MTPYEQLLKQVLETGTPKSDRTGTGTRSLFGAQMRFDLAEGFPLVTTKKVHFKSVVGELLWMLSGSTSVRELREKYGVTIWDEWELEDGTIGPGYGHQWRSFGGAQVFLVDREGNPCGMVRDHSGVDQIAEVVESIRTNPDSRRHIVSAWNPRALPQMALPPCHAMFQFYVAEGKLSCQLYQRSADMFLGVPFNIASYALLAHMIAQQTDLEVGDFVWTGGDVHLYENHLEQAKLQLSREPRPWPTLRLNKRESIFDYAPEDIVLEGYDPHPGIKASVAV